MLAVWLPRFISWSECTSVPLTIHLLHATIQKLTCLAFAALRAFRSTCARSPLLSSHEYPCEKRSRRSCLINAVASSPKSSSERTNQNLHECATVATASLQVDGERKRRKRETKRSVVRSMHVSGFSNRNFAGRILAARGSPRLRRLKAPVLYACYSLPGACRLSWASHYLQRYRIGLTLERDG